nr:hypothetical protein [Tanacetum cinerariifolium]
MKTCQQEHNTLVAGMTIPNTDFILSDNSLSESEIFYFDTKEKNIGSTTIHADISLRDLECFYFKIEPDSGELTSIVDYEIRKNVLSATNVNLSPEDDHLVSSLMLYGSVSLFLQLGVSHRSGTFMKFNVYQNHLKESPMEILSSTCSPIDQ